MKRIGSDSCFPVDPIKIGLAHGQGLSLPRALLAKMEAAFATDFSSVRIHVGPQAARLGALAFTTGNDLYFAPGQFQPDTIRGQQLIGHELTHVVQQRQGRVRAPPGGTSVVHNQALEAEADRLGMYAAGTVVRARPAPVAKPSLIVPRAFIQRSAVSDARTLTEEEVKKLIRDRDDMFTYKGDVVKDNVQLDRGEPLSTWLGNFSENSMIHLTPAASTQFENGMDRDSSFARLGDVIDMTVWEFKSKLVNACAGAFAVKAQLAVVWNGAIFEDDEGTFDEGYFADIFQEHVEGRGHKEYKTITKIDYKDLTFVEVKDWRTTDRWYLYPDEL